MGGDSIMATAKLIFGNCGDGGGGCCECDCGRRTGTCGCQYTLSVNIQVSLSWRNADPLGDQLRRLNINGTIGGTETVIFNPGASVNLTRPCSVYQTSNSFNSANQDYCCDNPSNATCEQTTIVPGGCGQPDTCSASGENGEEETIRRSPETSFFFMEGMLNKNKKIVISSVVMFMGNSIGFAGPNPSGGYSVNVIFPGGSQTVKLLNTASPNLPGQTLTLSGAIQLI
jgi:hypothetical protein